MGWVLSGEMGRTSRCRSPSAEEKATSFHAFWPVWNGPCAVVDAMHVETSFDRNLGDLIHARYGIAGRFMEA